MWPIALGELMGSIREAVYDVLHCIVDDFTDCLEESITPEEHYMYQT